MKDLCGGSGLSDSNRARYGAMVAPILAQSRWSERSFDSGGERESNPPAGFRPHTDFEGMSDARGAFRSVTSGFVFGHHPPRCKDLGGRSGSKTCPAASEDLSGHHLLR